MPKRVKPCIHGDVCREYMKKFGWLDVDGKMQACIISTACPDCKFYQSIGEDYTELVSIGVCCSAVPPFHIRNKGVEFERKGLSF